MEATEFKLLNWRGDSILAERMCADILVMSDFDFVDPQSPLGGPDGTKDILCEKNNWKYVAAVYFPPLPKNYRSIKKKFLDDLKGVSKNNADGIIFMTNQKITPSQKDKLKKEASNQNAKSIIYDNESIRSLLDSAMGFPIRLQYLKIKMSKADQLAFFSKQESRIPQIFDRYSKIIINKLSKKIDDCCDEKSFHNTKLDEVLSLAERTFSLIKKQEEPSDKTVDHFPKGIDVTTRSIDSETLCFIHKAMLYGTDASHLGNFRTNKVWIGSPKSTLETASFVPPNPEEVPELINSLLKDWRDNYDELIKSENKKRIVKSISSFHTRFLSIHPFLDGNGRIARFILNLQAEELLDVEIKRIIIEDRPTYINALREAQEGNLEQLNKIISQAIFGEDIF